MKDPRASVVRDESDRDVIVGLTNADNISQHRVDVVVSGASRAADDMEVMLMKELEGPTDTIFK